ncbi:MAG: D-tyrosyl-tRNA(Tyr) deacylase [Methanomicrobiales archaeon]|nr:D-tyrosyl-tRNA(Tyr) deacylase [Methanomicrobiales archaeon]
MLSTILISSRKDPAGSNIHKDLCTLLEQHHDILSHIHHWFADERLIYLNGSILPSDADQILFLSRHASERPRPVLTVHVTGNYGPADYGGTPSTLTPSATSLMHSLIKGLVRYAPAGYEVMYEATHHGPTNIPLPSCFVEIGSTEKEWNDRNGTMAVARAVLDALTRDPLKTIPLAGFGGTHYTQRQTEISKTTRGGFGHIMPTRDLQYLTGDMFERMVTLSQAIAIYIDGKSLTGEEERKISKFAEKFYIPVLGQQELTHLSSLDLSEYLTIRSLADLTIPKSNIILHDLHSCPNPVIVNISPDLIEEVMKTIPEEFLTGLDNLPVVHLTGKGKACHPVFITERTCHSVVKQKITDLCMYLIKSKNSVKFDGNIMVITKNRFDPSKAKDLGIPPGPLYKELMSGKTIQCNGKSIKPEMVMTITEKKIFIRDNDGS